MRHYAFQANDASNRIAGIDRPKSEFWYPGGNISGPLFIPGTDFNKGRDKAFFFFGAELQRQRLDDGTSLAVTPTERQRQGLFDDTQGGQGLAQPSQVLIPGGYPRAGAPAPNNDLRPHIDPFGQALLNRYPLPNHSEPDNRYNYAYNQVLAQDRLQLVLRVDYNITDSTRAYLRLAQDGEELDRARGVWGDTSSYELPSSILHKNRGRSAALNVASVLSPSTTNEILVTWSKLWLDIFHTEPGKTTLSGLGFPDFAGPWGQQVDRAPIQRSWGNFLGGLVDPLGQDLFAYNSSLQISDTFTTSSTAVRWNFPLGGSKKLQIRAGFFNVFNQSSATHNLGFNDIDLQLETQCNVRVNGVPNGSGGFAGGVCDPEGGFHYTENTLENFGKINLKRGRRIVEFAVKLYF